jgi:hypothetical protein
MILKKQFMFPALLLLQQKTRFSKLKYIVLPFWNPHEGKVFHNQVCNMPSLEITFKEREIPQCRFNSFSNPSQQINLLVSCNKKVEKQQSAAWSDRNLQSFFCFLSECQTRAEIPNVAVKLNSMM